MSPVNNETSPWWLSNAGKADGPFTSDVLVERIRTRELSPDAYVCKAGTDAWQRLADCPEFAGEFADTPPPPPPPDSAISSSARPTSKQDHAWNPFSITLLGILLTPFWSGIMAAINAKRLGVDQPLWRPLTIGIGSQLVALAAGCAGLDLGILWSELIFTLAPLVLLWSFDLSPQYSEYERKGEENAEKWFVPLLAGSPLALMTIVYWGIVLFAPLSPAETVHRLLDASSTNEARKYCTTNMHTLLDGIDELDRITGNTPVDDNFEIDLLDEYYGEYSDNESRVDYRMKTAPTEHDPASTLHGYFYLRWLEGRWQIDDWIITAHSQHPGGIEPVSFSTLLPEMLEEARRQHPQEQTPSLGQRFNDGMEFLRRNWYLVMGGMMLIAAMLKSLGKRF